MTRTTNGFFDEAARLVTSAIGAAQGVRDEAKTIIRTQTEKVLSQMDIVRREEFEAVKAMAEKARLENEKLSKQIEDLEIKLDQTES
ncbi:MAG: accessory factor UbiK family protein [Hyphomicrobiaceae bacterium]|nr:accessory factor UbiK family protein [Hyphomicrobiaceae bacterium]